MYQGDLNYSNSARPTPLRQAFLRLLLITTQNFTVVYAESIDEDYEKLAKP
jgi:hypothetical protein